jgi:hypothetical protein
MTDAMSIPQISTPKAGDTLTPSEELAFVSPAPAVTADVAESPEGAGAGVKVSICFTPAGVSKDRAFPRFLRRYMDGASGAHLESVAPEDDRKIPKFLRRHGAAHAQPIEMPQAEADQPNGFVPSIVLRDLRDGRVTSPVTPSQAPASASVTPAVTAAPPVVGSICPTCHCRIPARLSDAERQRAYRERKREQDKPIVP